MGNKIVIIRIEIQSQSTPEFFGEYWVCISQWSADFSNKKQNLLSSKKFLTCACVLVGVILSWLEQFYFKIGFKLKDAYYLMRSDGCRNF